MIFDEVKNIGQYAGLFPDACRKVEEFLAGCDRDIATGRHEIDGDNIFANVQRYNPKPLNPDKVEVHRQYIDIQLILSGEEEIYYSPVGNLKTVTSFEESGQDWAMYHLERVEDAVRLQMAPGNFAVFFPGEGHIPCVGSPESDVLKIVVKIKVNQ